MNGAKKIQHVTTWLATHTVLLAAMLPTHAETARGIVFDDRNSNGAHDLGEPGIAGVQVSNGLDVVTTGADGAYRLEIDDDEIVFVIKPGGWQTRIGRHNLPRFYYLHKPAGSPDDDFVYPGVEPTGPLPKSIDFALTKTSELDDFTVIVMGDPQPTDRRQVRFYANDVIAELVDTTAAFGLSMGDIVGNDLSLFGAVNAVQGVVGVPWYNVHGNHDINFRAPTDEYADETFERVYGPVNYAFEYGKVHFVVLDNVLYSGYRNGKNGSYQGSLSDRQLTFVENYLQTVPRDERVVVCTHIPLPEIPGQAKKHSTLALRRLLGILSSHPNTMSFSAHTHFNHHAFLGTEEGYHPEGGTGEHHHHNVATASGSWYRGPLDEGGFPVTTMADGAPNGYILARFKGSDYQLRYKAARMPENYQMAIRTPDVVDQRDTGATEIVVNVFNGTEKSKVRMQVRGQKGWRAMQRSPGVDPFYDKMHQRDVALAGADRRPLPGARLTQHLWRAHLPADLPVGVYVLEVEAIDMFGQVDRGIRLIEVGVSEKTRSSNRP